jgi:hypothetical protein
VQGRAAGAGPMDQLSGVTIYIFVVIVLGKWRKNSDSKSMNKKEEKDYGHLGERFDHHHKQRNAKQARMHNQPSL